MSTIEEQPNPDEAAEAKRAYMREYMRKRRQSKEHGDRYRATARESMREYMRGYRQKPEVAEAAAAKAKAKRDAHRTELVALRENNLTAYVGQVLTEQQKRKARNEYSREYQSRPEVKARRRERFEQKTEEEKQAIRAKARERSKISRIAKANGTDTQTVRKILARTANKAA